MRGTSFTTSCSNFPENLIHLQKLYALEKNHSSTIKEYNYPTPQACRVVKMLGHSWEPIHHSWDWKQLRWIQSHSWWMGSHSWPNIFYYPTPAASGSSILSHRHDDKVKWYKRKCMRKYRQKWILSLFICFGYWHTVNKIVLKYYKHRNMTVFDHQRNISNGRFRYFAKS